MVNGLGIPSFTASSDVTSHYLATSRKPCSFLFRSTAEIVNVAHDFSVNVVVGSKSGTVAAFVFFVVPPRAEAARSRLSFIPSVPVM